MTTVSGRQSLVRSRAAAAAAVVGVALIGQGCGVFGVGAKVAEAIESEKQLLIHAKYDGLLNKSVAVLVNADRTVLYEYPTVVPQIAANVALGIRKNVKGSELLSPSISQGWCFRTPSWQTMPYGEIAKELGVDRVVVIDLYEFRLNPPGNRWIWDGMAAANIGIIERDSIDPDSYAEEYSVAVKFPEVKDLSRESEPEGKIQLGLTAKFTQTVSKLFYTHLTPKHPDQIVR